MTIARDKKSEIDAIKKTTKTELAKSLGISRSSLYYKPVRPALDLELKAQVESVMVDHTSYGHKRIAIELKMNKKRILRIMRKFNLKPYRRRSRKPVKKDDLGKEPTKYKNLIKGFCPIRPNVVWVSDFTYIEYQQKFIYLATIMDLFTREIIGFSISRFHNKELTIAALLDAVDKQRTIPIYVHSDQGSEYTALEYVTLCEKEKIQVSMSKKATPGDNAFQESFYSQFKVDLGHTDRFESLGELVEAIGQAIYDYNHTRIHTSLKMSPLQFKGRYIESLKLINSGAVDKIV